MKAPLLSLLDANCAKGKHGPLTDGPPDVQAEHVNVEHRCSLCGRVVSETSWTREAWNQKHPQ